MQLNTVLAVLAGFCLAYVAADLFSQAGTMRQAIAAPPTKVETLAQQLQLPSWTAKFLSSAQAQPRSSA